MFEQPISSPLHWLLGVTNYEALSQRRHGLAYVVSLCLLVGQIHRKKSVDKGILLLGLVKLAFRTEKNRIVEKLTLMLPNLACLTNEGKISGAAD